jgi:RNA polymerase sigma factor (sigma-70 family)
MKVSLNEARKFIVDTYLEKAASYADYFNLEEIAGMWDTVNSKEFSACNEGEVDQHFCNFVDNVLGEDEERAKMEVGSENLEKIAEVNKIVEDARAAIALAVYCVDKFDETGGVPPLRNIADEVDFLRGNNHLKIILEDLFPDEAIAIRRFIELCGLPILADMDEIEENRAKLADDLWASYNRLNDFPAKNRIYKSGTKLPKGEDVTYSQGYYYDFYKGIVAARFEILFDGSKVAPEILPEQVSDNILEMSFRMGRIPSKEELGIENYDEAIKYIRDVLKADFHRVVAKYSTYQSLKLMVNEILFNRYSKYYKEYGFMLYRIWFADDIDGLCAHHRGMVSDMLKKKIFYRATTESREEVLLGAYVDKKFTSSLDEMPDGDLLKAVSERFGFEISSRIQKRFNRQTALKIVGFWEEHDIPIAPHSLCFTYTLTSIQKVFDRLEEVSVFLDECGNVPLKVRMNILRSRLEVEDIRKVMALFEDAGILPDYYWPYVCNEGVNHIKRRVIPRIQRTIKREKATPRPNDFPKSKLPIYFEMDKCTGQKGGGRAPSPMTPERQEALNYLKSVGCAYEDFNDPRTLPETVAPKVRLFIEAGLPVNQGMAFHYSIAAVKKRIQAVLDYRNEGRDEFDSFVEERGLTVPGYIRDGRLRGITLYRRIKRIEDFGVPFDDSKWWWLNAAKHAREHQMFSHWRKLTQENRREDLRQRYGVKKWSPVLMRKEPDNIWKGFRVMKLAGFTHRTVAISHMNQYGIGSGAWRKYLVGILGKKLDKGKRLTGVQNLFLRRYALASRAEEEFGWEDAHEIFDFADRKSLKIIKVAFDKKQDVDSLYELLNSHLKNHREIETRIRRAKGTYEDIEYFLDNVSLADLLERIEVFEQANLPVDVRLLRRSAEEIREGLSMIWTGIGEELNEINMKYLLNVGVNPVMAEKIARSRISNGELREKVNFYMSVDLDTDEYGVANIPVEYFEGFLDKPIEFCRNRGLIIIRRRMRNDMAKKNLADVLGLDWDFDQAELMRRNTPYTILEKYKLVGLYNAFSDPEEFDFRKFLLKSHSHGNRPSELLKLFFDEFKVKLKDMGLPEDKVSEFLEFAVMQIRGVCDLFDKAGLAVEDYIDELLEVLRSGDYSMIDTLCLLDPYDLASSIISSFDKVAELINVRHKFLTSNEEKALFTGYQESRDPKIKKALVMSNIGLVRKIAFKYQGRGCEVLDLFAEGLIGLDKAIEKFDVSKGFKLSTYATWWIRQAVTRYIADNSRTVRVPVHMNEKINRYHAVRARMIRDEDYSDENLAQELGYDADDPKFEELAMLAVKSARGGADSLDQPMGSDSEMTLMDTIEGGDDPTETLTLDMNDVYALRKLTYQVLRETRFGKNEHFGRNLLMFFELYGLNESRTPRILEDIGEDWGMTRERVRQVANLIIIPAIRKNKVLREAYADYLGMGD